MIGLGKSRSGSEFGNITLILAGIGMIVVASTCFREIPLVGTVFLIPGESILKAQLANPLIRHALFLAGSILTAFGSLQQVRNWVDWRQ